MPAAEPAFRVESIGDATCLRILKDLVSPTALAEIGAALMAIVAESDRVVVDMCQVGFMPTTMLGHLIAATGRLREKQSRLIVAGASAQIADVFIVAKVKDHFEFAATVESALSSSAHGAD